MRWGEASIFTFASNWKSVNAISSVFRLMISASDSGTNNRGSFRAPIESEQELRMNGLTIGQCECGKRVRMKLGKRPICPDCIRAFKQEQSKENLKQNGQKPHLMKVRHLKGRWKPAPAFEPDTHEKIVELAQKNGHCSRCGVIKESPDRKRCDRCIAISRLAEST